MKSVLYLLLFLPVLLQGQAEELQLSAHIFPTLEEGRILIVKDDAEDFFSKVGLLDMAIQLGDESSTDSTYLRTFLDYLVLLQKEVIPFSIQEQLRLRSLMSRAELEIMKVNEHIFPDTVYLVKIQGLTYGPGAFYTRENTVLVPGALLNNMDDEQLYSVLLHELFHIISRYHPALKDPLYAIAGFQALGDSLCLPEAVERRLLLNPDGMSTGHVIELKTDNGDVLPMLPLLVSNTGSYRAEKPGFFRYMAFQMYPVVDQDEHCKTLIIKPNGYSVIERDIIPIYQQKIGDITPYFIHPNEIMADHFSELIKSEESGDYSSYSEDGMSRLSQVLDVLKAYRP